MSAKSFSWRAGAFVRSILPAEPAHWLILVGSLLLFTSASLQWWPPPRDAASVQKVVLVFLLGRLLIVAGAAGLYLSLVPRKSQSLRPYYLMFVPAAIMFAFMAYLSATTLAEEHQESVVAQVTDKTHFLRAAALPKVLTSFRTGFWMAALGIVLVTIFCVLLDRGQATLPLRLSGAAARAVPGLESEDAGHRRTMRFAWALIALVPVVSLVANDLIVFPFLVVFRGSASSHLQSLELAGEISFSLCLFLLVVAVIGPGASEFLRRSLRFPEAEYLGIGVLIPVAIAAILPLLTYCYDRIHWAAFEPMHDAPGFLGYFAFPVWSQLLKLIPALAEEIAWRGFLQRRFIARYGIARGLFLLGVVWGAFHFSGDFRANMTIGMVCIVAVRRLYLTCAQSYVLGWLRLRSGSVLPCALAHGFYNIFLQIPVHTPLWIMPALWAVCAWLLFRYFPVPTPEPDATPESGPRLEAA